MGLQVAGGQTRRIAGSDHQGAALLQVIEKLARQSHCRMGQGDRMTADLGATANFFGGGEGMLGQLLKLAVQSAGLMGVSPGLFELTQNFRFSQHHGIQATCNMNRMTQSCIADMLVPNAIQNLAINLMPTAQPVQNGIGLRQPLMAEIQLRAVAGRQNQGAVDIGQRRQVFQGRAERIARKGDLLAQVKIGSLVIDAEGCQCHNMLAAGIQRGVRVCV